MNFSKGIFLHPFTRILFLVSTSLGVLFSNNIILLLITYIIFLIPLFIIANDLKKHLKLFVLGMLPILFSYILLYKFIPNSIEFTYHMIFTKFFKIVLITSVFQLFFSIPASDLVNTFKKYKIKGDYLIFIISSFTVWADVYYRTNKIISARLSRGFIEKRSILNYAKQIPRILVPLIISIIRSSIERVHSWEQRNTLVIFQEYRTSCIYYPKFFNYYVTLMSILFLLTSFLISIN